MTFGIILHQFYLWSYEVTRNFGYPGIFLINLISACTIIFPLPAYILTFVFAPVLNPIFISLAAAAGGSLGELVSYGAGFGGGYALKISQNKYFERGKVWFQQGRGFWAIIIFAATPLPLDVIAILSGALRYSIKKYLLAVFIGKMIMNLFLALAGFFGITWLAGLLNVGL